MPDPEMKKKGGCDWPDCGSWYSNKEIIKELQAVQLNQKDQISVQEKMLSVQLEAAKTQTNIHHIQEDLRKQDGRISDAFRQIEGKPQNGDIIPKEKLITKDDYIKLMAYTVGIITLAISAVVGLLKLAHIL